MKKNRYIYIGILFFVFLAIIIFDRYNLLKKVKLDENKIIFNSSPQEIEKKESISLVISDKNYSIKIREGETIFEVMKNLEINDENNFSFKYKEYPGMGIFVEEINGEKNGTGKYWLYSVNDKEAQIGISDYILKGGDIIRWELK